MNPYLLAALIVVVLSVFGVLIALGLERRHPEDAEREAFDRAAEDRYADDGGANESIFTTTRPETNAERSARYRRAASRSRSN